MPAYRCLDTEVQLCTWTPLMRYSTASNAIDTRIELFSVTKRPPPGASPRDMMNSLVEEEQGSSHDTTRSWKVIRLNEEHFRGYEGLDFLGVDMPFYLIHAGGDLYREINSLSDQAALQNPKPMEQDAVQKVPSTSTGSTSSSTGSSLFQSVRNTSKPSSMPKESSLPQTYGLNASPHLPSMPSLLVLPLLESPSPHSNGGIRQFASKSVISKQSSESFKNTGGPPMKGNLPCAPELLPRPLKVVVKLSEKSFLPPFFHADDKRFDVCINIFYNGQFSHSQIVAHSTWSTGDRTKMLHCSGMRIGTSLEVPWVLDLARNDEKSHLMMTSLGRWQKIGEMLMAEANRWGIDERGNRCPTGDYLELLTKRPIPADLEVPIDHGGGRFGVIDVVVVFGRSSSTRLAGPLTSPRRKDSSESMIEQCLPTKSQGNIPTIQSVPTKVRAPHPGRPKVIPQKRYRGNELELGAAQPENLQKTLDSEPSLEVGTPTALRTRSRGSTVPFNEMPMNTRRKRVNKIKKTSDYGNEPSSEEQIRDIPSTPSKDLHAVTSTTPKSSSPSKKKRPINYNPKYSNRPQNLRRKNSAGEWETPTKDGWVVETWTKSAKAAKAKSQTDTITIVQPFTSIVSESSIQQAMTNRLTSMAKDGSISSQTSQKAKSPVSKADDCSIWSNEKDTIQKFVEREKRTPHAVKNTLDAEDIAVPNGKSQQKTFRIKFFQGSRRAKEEKDLPSVDGVLGQAECSSSLKYVSPLGSSKKTPLKSFIDNDTNRLVYPGDLIGDSSFNPDIYKPEESAELQWLSKSKSSTDSLQNEISWNEGMSKFSGESGHVIATLRNPELPSHLLSSETFEVRSELISRKVNSTTVGVQSVLNNILVEREPDSKNSKTVVMPVAKITTIPKIYSAANKVTDEPRGGGKVTAVLKSKRDGLGTDMELLENANEQKRDTDLATRGSKTRRSSLRGNKGNCSMPPELILNPLPKPNIDPEITVGNANSENAEQPVSKRLKISMAPIVMTQVVKDENFQTTHLTVESQAPSDSVDTQINSVILIADHKARETKKHSSKVKKNQDTTNAELSGKITSNQPEVKKGSIIEYEFGESLTSDQLPNLKIPVRETNKRRSRNAKSSPQFATETDIATNQAILSPASSAFALSKKTILNRKENTPTSGLNRSDKMVEFNNKLEEGDIALALKEIGKAKGEIDKAAEVLESLATQTHARAFASNGVPSQDIRQQATKSKNCEETVNKAEASERIDVSKPSTVRSASSPWKPSPLCEGSVLTYADSDEWVGFNRDPLTGYVHRTVGQEMNSSFKESGVLMGVRFVVGI